MRTQPFGVVVLSFAALAGSSQPAEAVPPSAGLASAADHAQPAMPAEHARPPMPQRHALPWVQVAGHRYRPLSMDGHVHTRHSPDAFETTDEVLALCARGGLDAVVITDHGVSEAAREVRAYQGPIMVALGEEVGGPWGHAVVWNVTRRRGIAESLETLSELGTHTHAAGGLLVLAHPTWWMKRHEDAMHWMSVDSLRKGGQSGEIDAFEIWNSIYIEREDQLVEAWLRALDQGVFVPAVGASDFHRESSHRLGRPRNVALSETHTIAGVLEALRRGRSYVTDEAGLALTVDGKATLGDAVSIVPGQSLEVAVEITTPRSGGTLVLYEGRNEVLREQLPKDQTWNKTVRLTAPARDSYLRVEIRRLKAHPGRPDFSLISNPVLLDVAPRRTSWR